jgi:hypothetical protein
MTFEPGPLTEAARKAMQPALDRSNVTWAEVEGWLAEGSACVWRINDGQAYVLTLATEDEIEGVLAGGSGAREWAAEFGRAMLEYPAHKGRTLSVTGRKGWARLLPEWSRAGDELRLS